MRARRSARSTGRQAPASASSIRSADSVDTGGRRSERRELPHQRNARAGVPSVGRFAISDRGQPRVKGVSVRIKPLFFAAALASALSFAPAGDARAVPVERVFAVVNDRPILLSELRHRAIPNRIRQLLTSPNGAPPM